MTASTLSLASHIVANSIPPLPSLRPYFKSDAIAVSRHGILNLHSGILPDYCGVIAPFWAMPHNETTHGCTLHHITDASIDTGAIIGFHRVPLWARSLVYNTANLHEGGVA